MSYRDTPEWKNLDAALREFLRAEVQRDGEEPDMLIDFAIVSAHMRIIPTDDETNPYSLYTSSTMSHITRGLLHEALAFMDKDE